MRGMILRYLAASALTLAAALLLTAGSAAHGRHRPKPSATLPPSAALRLYSTHALRQARIILQLKLLELREERLERVRKALQRHANIDEILRQR